MLDISKRFHLLSRFFDIDLLGQRYYTIRDRGIWTVMFFETFLKISRLEITFFFPSLYLYQLVVLFCPSCTRVAKFLFLLSSLQQHTLKKKKKKKEAYPATFYTRTTNRPSSNNKIARRIFNRSVFPINSRIRVGIKPIPIETGRPALKRTVS